MDMTEPMTLPHRLTLNERQQLHMTGVTEVISFDDSAVVLRTELGNLSVHGQQLQLKTLSVDGGQIAVEGSVTALIYEEPKPRAGLLGRLFG
jgi:sporulation protein YabP